MDLTLKPSLLTKACPACGQTYQPISAEGAPGHRCPKAGASAAATAVDQGDSGDPSALYDDLVGATLAERYYFERVLDKGGMGIVYAARHAVLRTPLAVKLVRQRRGSAGIQRFFREAQLASKLRHPNIVYIQDFGLLPGGLPYLVMELVAGKTLAALLKQGPLAVDRACRIALQVARGMQVVHAAGIVHRDLKPENIMVDEMIGEVIGEVIGESVKIIDFGIAKELDKPQAPGVGQPAGQPPITRAGAFVGSPRYMSPEQAQSQEVDARGDQYSLGCILYKMLTGTPPFEGASEIDLLWMHINEPVQPPRQRRPELKISDALEATVLRALAKRRDERFPSMEAFAQALANELQPPAGRTLLGMRPRLLFGVLAALLAAGIGGGLAYRWATAPRSLTADAIERSRRQAIEVLLQLAQSSAEAPPLSADAWKALGLSQQPALLPQLTEALRNKEAAVQRGAAEALGRLGEPAALAALRQRLAEPGTPPVLVAVAQAVDNLGDPGGIGFLERALHSADAGLPRAAALALCARRGPEVRAQLALLENRPLAESEDLPLLTCLARAGESGARLRLLALFEQAARTEARFVVAARLLELGEPRGQAFLHDLMVQPSPQQLAAARLLATPAEPYSAALFRRVLDDTRATAAVRLLAAEGLGLSGQLADLRRLQPLLSSAADAATRVVAARSMLQLIQSDPARAAQQSLLWVRAALDDVSPEVRQTAVEVLAEDGAHNIVPALLELAKDQSPIVRQQAVRALGLRAAPAAVTTVRRALKDSDAAVRAEAIRALPRVLRDSPSAPLSEAGLSQLRQALQPVIASGTAMDQALARSQLLRLGDSAQLGALRTPAAVDVRLAVVRENSSLPNFLRGFLKDADWQVRWAAARALADFLDKAAVPVLQEAIERRGPEAMPAYQRLVQLKVAVPSPPSIDRWLDSDVAARRIEAVESITGLPVELAVPLLTHASHDPEPLVRLMVVAVVGGLVDAAAGQRARSELTALLQSLMADGNSVVRMRASAISLRLLPPSDTPATRGGPQAALAPLDPELLVAAQKHGEARPAEPAVAAANRPAAGERAGPRTFNLTVTAAAPVWFHVDKRPWLQAAHANLTLPPGAHSVSTIDKTQSVDLREAQEVKLEPSTLEQLVKSGLKALGSGDLRSGQRSLERALAICARDRGIEQPCGALSYDLSFRLATVYEKQAQWADAMNEMQRLSAMAKSGAIKARPDQLAAVLAAIGRLGARLGQVVLVSGKKGKGGCQEKTLWLPPGTHSINHAGKTVSVVVRAKQTVRVGTCE